MSLGASLSLVIAAFVALMAAVMFMALHERRAGKSIATHDTAAQAASDARVLFVIFAAIPGGMLLTILVAWLLFL
jgi:hypothetical protein